MKIKNKVSYLKQEGITLIALVVTIVILLILAGVTINALFSENGLIKRIETAKEKKEIAEYVDDLSRKVLEARTNVAGENSKVLEETKRLIEQDEKYTGAIIGEVTEDNKITVITKEGYKIDVKEDGATFVEKGLTPEDMKKLKLTVKHVDKSGKEVGTTTEERYSKDTSLTVNSKTIEGYKTYSAKITATEVNEILTEGAPVELSFRIYADTEVVITYDTISSGETQKEYAEKPTIGNSSQPATVKPIEKNSNITVSLPPEIKNTDKSYLVDIEPVKGNSGPLIITLDVSDKAEDGDTANVRHYKNNAWENLGDYIVEQGKITVTIDSFSPFYITIKKKQEYKEPITVLTENALYTDSENKTVIIPKGFKLSDVAATADTDGEQTISKGLVIKDSKGNEFVWIPVEYTATGADENNNGLDDGFEATFKRKKYDSFQEPYENGYPGEEEDYMKMMRSVQKNKGFYIGRYEAGTTSPRTASTTTTSTVVVQRDAYPYNYVCWGNYRDDILTDATDKYNKLKGKGAVYLSQTLYPDTSKYTNLTNNTGVISNLCYGVQWDAMVKFITDNEQIASSSILGNADSDKYEINRTSAKYAIVSSSSEIGTWTSVGNQTISNANNKLILTTGASDSFSSKNIFDVKGNVNEYTMEAVAIDSCNEEQKRQCFTKANITNENAYTRYTDVGKDGEANQRFPSIINLVLIRRKDN